MKSLLCFNKYIISFLLIFFLLLSSSGVSVYAESNSMDTFVNIEEGIFTTTDMGNKTMYVDKGVVLRSEPDKDSEAICFLQVKEVVKVSAKVDGRSWYKVSVGDKAGYVNMNYLTSTKPEFTIEAIDKIVYCTKQVSFRKGPGKNYSKIRNVLVKEKIDVLAKVNGYNWYKVKIGTKIGYVHGDYFSSKKPKFVISVYSKTMYCLKNTIVRTGPNKEYDKINTITPNEKVSVVAKVVGKDWYQVKYGNKTGYVYSKNFTSKKPNFIVKKISKSKYSTASINIRKGPSTKYRKLYTISKNTKLKLTGEVVNSKWYRVKYNGKTGYVDGSYLSNTKVNYIIIGTYKDKTSKITVYKQWYKNAWCYIAHLEFSNYKRFGTSCAKGTYGRSELIQNANDRLDSILIVNGCYSAPYLGYPVARSGKVCNDKPCWVPAVYSRNNGKLMSAWETGGTQGIAGVQLSSLVKNGKVSDTFCFGPPFLSDGKITASSDKSRAQRTFIGTNGNPGDIWVVVSDGRYVDGKSAGLTGYECASLLKSKGCTFGVPLDGGGSSTMMFKDKVLNKTTGRAVVDFVYFR